MICEEAQTQLTALHDRELSPRIARRVKDHMNTCAECRKAYSGIQKLHTLLRDNDMVDPVPTPAPAPRVKNGRMWRVGMALAAACAIAGVIVTGSIRPKKSFAAEVQDAIAHTTTYHLSGWRQVGGKKVDWEIWGRRYPYIYCEKVGDDWIYDNGTVQTRIYAPNAASGRSIGMVVRAASNSGNFSGEIYEPEWSHMIDPGFWHSGQIEWLRPVAQTATTATYGRQFPLGVSAGVNANELFTIDKQKRLPTHYCLRYNTRAVEWFAQDMTIECDVKLPKEASAIPDTPGYQIVDLRPSAASLSSRPGPNADLRIGLRVETQPLAVVQDGTIVIDAKVSPQSSRPAPAVGPPFSFAVAPKQTMTVVCRDSHGARHDVPYLNAFFNVTPPGNILMLTPIDDLPHGWRPVAVVLPVTTTVWIAGSGLDLLGSNGHPLIQSTTNTVLTSETNTVSLSLVQPGITQSLEPYVDRIIGRYGHNSMNAIKQKIADAHASYWWGVPDYKSLYTDSTLALEVKDPKGKKYQAFLKGMENRYAEARRKDLMKAAGWLLKVADLMDLHAPDAYMRLYRLQTAALYYAQAGRIDLERKTLRRLLSESKTVSGVGELRRDTEAALQGKKLPGQ